jgi:hypothetical protein
MLSPCVVTSGGSRVRQIWPRAILFLWGYLRAQVYQHRPQTLEGLKEAITQEIADILPEMNDVVFKF